MGDGAGASMWVSRPRDYAAEEASRSGSVQVEDATDEHPLRSTAACSTPAAAAANDGGDPDEADDPLQSAAMADPLSPMKDPLSIAAAAQTEKTVTAIAGSEQHFDDSFEPWSMKRQGILSRYTTNERLSIVGLDDGEGGKIGVAQQNSTMSDKVKNRLEQIDDMDTGNVQQMLDLSQQEYVNRIDELNDELSKAWKSEQRVKALKIAIQCAKLLADTRVIQFYPSKFVLITDILDNFGTLVSDRIEEKSVGPGQRLPANFTPDMIPAQAKETCRNWFFKIASIRELIPRLFVETALLKCYSFLTQGEYEQALLRLSNMMRGIGDPLVAIYARCYICRVGVNVAASVKSHLMPCFDDFMSTYAQLETASVQDQIKAERIKFSTYVNLFVPALDWILQCIAYKADEDIMDRILQTCQDSHNVSLLINSIMSAFPPNFISQRAVQFCTMIREASEDGLPKHHLYRTLGMNVSFHAPPEADRLQILNDVWRIVMELEDPGDYIACAEVWIEYPVKNFGKREVNAMLKNVLEHMTVDRAFEKFFPQLQSMLYRILANMKDQSALFSMDKLLPFIDLFQKEDVRIEVCKTVMESFVRHQEGEISDPVVLHALMYIGKILHDSVSPMTFADERKQITELIVAFLSKIAFGRDFEQTLQFLVSARSSFTNLDPVMAHLVQRVDALAMRTLKLVKGRHNRKTSTFVRSCFAFSFITIPSIESYTDRLELYLHSAQCAVVNQCLSQAEAMMKHAIRLIPELPSKIDWRGESQRDADDFLVPYTSTLINALLLVPDNPDQGPMYLVKSLLTALAERQYTDDSDAKVVLLTRSIGLLAAATQPDYQFQIANVTLNDELYGGSPKFVEAVAGVVEVVKDQILQHLQSIGAAQSRQIELTLRLFDTVSCHGDLTAPKVVRLLTNLWGLASKAGASASVKAKSVGLIGELVDRGVQGAADLQAKLY